MTIGDLAITAKLPCAILALMLISSTLLSACGQKGALVLPGTDAAPIATETAPADESDDGTEEEGETSGE